MDQLRKLKRIRFWVLLIAALVIFGAIVRACSDPESEPDPASDRAATDSAPTTTTTTTEPTTTAPASSTTTEPNNEQTTTTGAPNVKTTTTAPGPTTSDPAVPTTLTTAPSVVTTTIPTTSDPAVPTTLTTAPSVVTTTIPATNDPAAPVTTTAAPTTTTTAPATSDPAVSTTLAAPPVSTAPEDGNGVRVVRVVDGDTIIVLLNGEETRVRLIGINAPESDECLAEEAGRRLEELLAGEVRLETDEEETDRFGRMLAYIWAGEILVNERLAAEGLALARAYQPNVSRQTVLDEAAADARRGGVGMWAPDACGPPTGANLEITEISWNPPGPDGDDLNGEYLVLRNLSDEPAPLDGFVLRDASSSNRYKFPGGWILPGRAEVTIHAGTGTDDQDSLYWDSDLPIWNNGGDEAFILDPSGNITAYYSYTG